MPNNAYELAEQLKGLGFGDHWQLPLAFRMRAGLPSFQLRITERSSFDQAWYYLHFVKTRGTGNFSLDRYQALVRKQVAVPTGNLEGIDTSNLDRQMAAVDWSLNYGLFDDRHFTADPGLLDKYEAYLRVATQLVQLAASEKGSSVATALALNHFAEHSPSLVFSDFEREKKKWELSNTFYINGQEALTKDEARNILYGRSVWRSFYTANGERISGWFKQSAGVSPDTGTTNFHFFEGGWQFPPYDLERAIKSLPLAVDNTSARMLLREQLQQGELIEVLLKAGNRNHKKLFVAANPETASLDLYSGHGKKQSLENFLRYSLPAAGRRRGI